MNVLILGANGMLGRMVFDYFCRHTNYKVHGVVKTQNKAYELAMKYNTSVFHNDDIFELVRLLVNKNQYDYVVNCIGVVKPRINESDSLSIENAIKINSLLPREIARHFSGRIIQIATDCVYDGKLVDGDFYVETSLHNATDVYGKTKSLGEVKRDNFINLRASIIGPELENKYSLLEWVLKQPRGAKVNGFTNHRWNGVTTLAFAKVVFGLTKSGFNDNVRHLVPEDIVTKHQLVSEISGIWDRNLNVTYAQGDKINRVLNTSLDGNKELWLNAGYIKVPTVKQMLVELYCYKICD